LEKQEIAMENLERRIAAALADDAITSTALSELLQETDAAIIAADATAEKERAKALDPALSPDLKGARQAMEDAAFAADRLRTLLPRLQKRCAQVQRAEVKSHWVAQYDELAPRVTALAEELKAIYTDFVPKIVDVLTRARKLNTELRRVRSAKPYPETGEALDGRDLYEVELVARSITTFGLNDLSLDKHLVLPDFERPSQKAWPPYEVPFAVQVALAMKRY
jgi:hypothetical protein